MSKERELLRRAYVEFERLYDFHKLDHTQTLLYEEIENFLAAEPEAEPVAIVDGGDDGYWAEILPDRSVKRGQLLYLLERLTENAEPEADKPVAWMHPNGGVIQARLTGLERDTYTIPLYTRPSPSRKLMTDAESYDEYKKFMDRVDGDVDPWTSFGAGIFAAEKHHGTGG